MIGQMNAEIILTALEYKRCLSCQTRRAVEEGYRLGAYSEGTITLRVSDRPVLKFVQRSDSRFVHLQLEKNKNNAVVALNRNNRMQFLRDLTFPATRGHGVIISYGRE